MISGLIKGPHLAPTQEQIIHNRTEGFNRYLRDNEHDVNKWLEFISFQDETISSDREKVEGKSKDVVLLDKKLSVCEKALQYNPKSIALLLERMAIITNLWEYEKINSEWTKLTFLYPNEMRIWHEYILFSRTQISHFSVSKTCKIYKKCITILDQMLEGTFKSHAPPENLERELIDIISSYCEFNASVGNMEKAIATFQALIEFNCFTPSLLTMEMSVQDWIAIFEPFWDSGNDYYWGGG